MGQEVTYSVKSSSPSTRLLRGQTAVAMASHVDQQIVYIATVTPRRVYD
jgi:hypothetical protein